MAHEEQIPHEEPDHGPTSDWERLQVLLLRAKSGGAEDWGTLAGLLVLWLRDLRSCSDPSVKKADREGQPLWYFREAVESGISSGCKRRAEADSDRSWNLAVSLLSELDRLRQDLNIDLRNRLQAALLELKRESPRDYRVLTLQYIGRLPVGEIASILGLSVRGVEIQAKQARDFLCARVLG